MLVDEIDRRKAESPPAPEGDIALGYAIITSLLLALVNFTLSALARTEYGQDDVWWPSFWLSVKSLPLYMGIIYLLHSLETPLTNVLGVCAGTGFGCGAVWLFNNEGYYASMVKVPQLGTIWVWLIIEIHPALGALTLLAVGLYTWLNGFRLM